MSHYQDHYIAKSAVRGGDFPKHPKNFVLPESGFKGESSYADSYKGFDGNYNDLRAQIARRMMEQQKAPFQG